MSVEENKECYFLNEQRDVLVRLLSEPLISEEFFLTGGTALAVFYLHHRLSNDLDLFTRRETSLEPITEFVKRTWAKDAVKIKESRMFASFSIHGTKVDFVIDPLSFDEVRERITIEPGAHLTVDTLRNIRSNKLTAIVSRTEPKDYIDFFMLAGNENPSQWEEIYNDAKRKDALFDDPPTVAYQIEEAFRTLQENTIPFPRVLTKFDRAKFDEFYTDFIYWIYDMCIQ